MPRKQASPDVEADAPLLPGWKYLEHITPRRPGRSTAKRGRKTWGVRYKDPHLPPDHEPVTVTTGKQRQPEALSWAKDQNAKIDNLIRDIASNKVTPDYLKRAHVQRSATRKTIKAVVDEAAAAQPNDYSARHIQDFGDHLVHYCKPLGVEFMDEITHEILLGWLRSVILEPCKTHQSGEAKWFSTVDLWTRITKTTLRSGLKFAPQLNTDILRDALPTFTRKKGQAALLKVLINPTPEQREWIMARQWGREPSGGDMDEGGRSLSQATLHTLYHAALRYDCRQLRALIQKQDRTAEDIEACKLVSVDVTALLLDGFRRAEYTTLKVGGVLLDQPEPMDRKQRTHLVKVVGKGRRERNVPLSGYTQIGVELARVQTHRRDKNEYVAEHNYVELDSVFGKLTSVTWIARQRNERGRWEAIEKRGPRCVPKDMRSTGCNFAQRLHHVPLETRAERWGHTVAVHVTNYLKLTGSALAPCATLEEAMGCASLMRRAVRLLEIRNSIGTAPRTTARKVSKMRRAKEQASKTARATRKAPSPEQAAAKFQRVG